MKAFFNKIGSWLILFMATDMAFILLTWLIRPEAIKSVSLFIILFTLIMIGIGYVWQRISRRKKLDAFKSFLDDPNEETKAALAVVLDDSWSQMIESAYSKIQKQTDTISEKQIGLQNYQEYIEAWTHEIKTPLSLMTLILENHYDEISTYVADRLHYVRLQISQDVERILYYARLQTNHADYNFSRIRLDECVVDVLSDYSPLAEEKKTTFTCEMQPLEVVSDRKVLSFMISQLVSNAVKYASQVEGKVTVIVTQDKDVDAKIRLAVHDNGNGVPAEDALFREGIEIDPDRVKETIPILGKR